MKKTTHPISEDYKKNQACLEKILFVWLRMHTVPFFSPTSTIAPSFSEAKSFIISEHYADTVWVDKALKGFILHANIQDTPSQSTNIIADIMVLLFNTTKLDHRILRYMSKPFIHSQPGCAFHALEYLYTTAPTTHDNANFLILLISQTADMSFIRKLISIDSRHQPKLCQKICQTLSTSQINDLLTQFSGSGEICKAIFTGLIKNGGFKQLEQLMPTHYHSLPRTLPTALIQTIISTQYRHKMPFVITNILQPHFGKKDYYALSIIELAQERKTAALKTILRDPIFSNYHFKYQWERFSSSPEILTVIAHCIPSLEFCIRTQQLVVTRETAKVCTLKQISAIELSQHLEQELKGASLDVVQSYLMSFLTKMPNSTQSSRLLGCFEKHRIFKPFHLLIPEAVGICLLASDHYQIAYKQYRTFMVKALESAAYRKAFIREVTRKEEIFMEWFQPRGKGHLAQILPHHSPVMAETWQCIIQKQASPYIQHFVKLYPEVLTNQYSLALIKEYLKHEDTKYLANFMLTIMPYLAMNLSNTEKDLLDPAVVGPYLQEGQLTAVGLDKTKKVLQYAKSYYTQKTANETTLRLIEQYPFLRDQTFFIPILLSWANSTAYTAIPRELCATYQAIIANYTQHGIPRDMPWYDFCELAGMLNIDISNISTTYGKKCELSLAVGRVKINLLAWEKILPLMPRFPAKIHQRLISETFQYHHVTPKIFSSILPYITAVDFTDFFQHAQFNTPEKFNQIMTSCMGLRITMAQILHVLAHSSMSKDQVLDTLLTYYPNYILSYQLLYPDAKIEDDLAFSDLNKSLAKAIKLITDSNLNTAAIHDIFERFTPWSLSEEGLDLDKTLISKGVSLSKTANMKAVVSNITQCHQVFRSPERFPVIKHRKFSPSLAIHVWAFYKRTQKFPSIPKHLPEDTILKAVSYILDTFEVSKSELAALMTLFSKTNVGPSIYYLLKNNHLSFRSIYQALLKKPENAYLQPLCFSPTAIDQLNSHTLHSDACMKDMAKYQALFSHDTYCTSIAEILHSSEKEDLVNMANMLCDLPPQVNESIIVYFIEHSSKEQWLSFLQHISFQHPESLLLIQCAPNAYLKDALEGNQLSLADMRYLYNHIVLHRAQLHKSLDNSFTYLIDPRSLTQTIQKHYIQSAWNSVFTEMAIEFPFIIFIADVPSHPTLLIPAAQELIALYKKQEQLALDIEWAFEFPPEEVQRMTEAVIALIDHQCFETAIAFISHFTLLQETEYIAQIINHFAETKVNIASDSEKQLVQSLLPQTLTTYQELFSQLTENAQLMVNAETLSHVNTQKETPAALKKTNPLIQNCIKILLAHQRTMPLIDLIKVQESMDIDSSITDSIIDLLIQDGYLVKVEQPDGGLVHTGYRISSQLDTESAFDDISQKISMYSEHILDILEHIYNQEETAKPMLIQTLYEQLGVTAMSLADFKALLKQLDQFRVSETTILLDPSIETYTARSECPLPPMSLFTNNLLTHCKKMLASLYQSHEALVSITLCQTGRIALPLKAADLQHFLSFVTPVIQSLPTEEQTILWDQLCSLFNQSCCYIHDISSIDSEYLWSIQRLNIPCSPPALTNTHQLDQQLASKLIELKKNEIITSASLQNTRSTVPIIWCYPTRNHTKSAKFTLFLSEDPYTKNKFFSRLSLPTETQEFKIHELQQHVKTMPQLVLLSPHCQFSDSVKKRAPNSAALHSQRAQTAKSANSWWERVINQSSSKLKKMLSTLEIKEAAHEITVLMQAVKRPQSFDHIEAFLPNHITPRAHQIHAFQKIVRTSLPGNIINFSVGGGKTLLSIALVMRMIKISLRPTTTVIVCPVTVIDVWKKELSDICVLKTTYEKHHITVQHNSLKHTVIVGSHPSLKTHIDNQLEIDALVVDEAHAFCNKSQNQKNLSDLIETNSIRLLLLNTATPIISKMGNLLSLAKQLLTQSPSLQFTIDKLINAEDKLDAVFRKLMKTFTHDDQILSADALLHELGRSAKLIGITSQLIELCLTSSKDLRPALHAHEYKRLIPAKAGHCDLCSVPHESVVHIEHHEVEITPELQAYYTDVKKAYEQSTNEESGKPATLFAYLSRLNSRDTTYYPKVEPEQAIPLIIGLSKENFAKFIKQSPRVQFILRLIKESQEKDGIVPQIAIFSKTYLEAKTILASIHRVYSHIAITTLTGQNSERQNILNKNLFNNIISVDSIRAELLKGGIKCKQPQIGMVLVHLKDHCKILTQLNETTFSFSDTFRFALSETLRAKSHPLKQTISAQFIKQFGRHTKRFNENSGGLLEAVVSRLYEVFVTRIVICTPTAIEGISLSADILIDAGLSGFTPDTQFRGRIGRIGKLPLHGQTHRMQPGQQIHSRIIKLSNLLSAQIFSTYQKISLMLLEQASITDYSAESISLIENAFIKRVAYIIAKSAALYDSPVNADSVHSFIEDFPECYSTRDGLKEHINGLIASIKTNIPGETLSHLLYKVACYIDLPTTLSSFRILLANTQEQFPSIAEAPEESLPVSKRHQPAPKAPQAPAPALPIQHVQPGGGSAAQSARPVLYINAYQIFSSCGTRNHTYDLLYKYSKHYGRAGYTIRFICTTEQKSKTLLNLRQSLQNEELYSFITQRLNVEQTILRHTIPSFKVLHQTIYERDRKMFNFIYPKYSQKKSAENPRGGL